MTSTAILKSASLKHAQHFGSVWFSVALAIGIGFWLCGCARGVATTTVSPNGSWVRRVAFHGSKPDKGDINMGMSIGDAFVLPAGKEWKITHEDTKEDAVVVAERTLMPGETLHGDITVKNAKKPTMPIAVNEVSVQKAGPGIFKYTETLHWNGPVPKELTPDASMVATFKKALPPGLATDANARELAMLSTRDLWRILFGPGDPLIANISSILMQPELVERRVQQRVGGILEQHISAKFGTQLTPQQRRAATFNIIHNSLFNISDQAKSAGPGGDKTGKTDDSTPGASLFIAVKLPGRITATNGERDPVSGEVYWSLYPEAAALGDVTLTATCDTNAQAASR